MNENIQNIHDKSFTAHACMHWKAERERTRRKSREYNLKQQQNGLKLAKRNFEHGFRQKGNDMITKLVKNLAK